MGTRYLSMRGLWARFLFWLLSRNWIKPITYHACGVCDMPEHPIPAPILPTRANCCVSCGVPFCVKCYSNDHPRCLECDDE